MDTRQVTLEKTETDAVAVRYGKCIIGAVAKLPFQDLWAAYHDGRLVATAKTDWAAAYALARWCGY
jgi:hypothetical protein